MAIGVYFHPKGLTLEQFNEVHRRLVDMGQEHPAGRLHHSCFGDDGELMVFEVWASPEEFEAFAPTLMPVLAEVGVDPGEPGVMPIHKLTQFTADQ